MKRLERVWSQTNLSTSTKIRIYSTCVLVVLLYGSETWTLTQLDWMRLESFHVTREVSAADPPHPMARLHTQQRSSSSHWSVGSFFHRSQMTSRTVRSCCQTYWRCISKSDPSDLLRSIRRCPAMFRLETCPRPTSHHLDSADLTRHWSYGDRRPAAGRRPIVLATNRNDGKLRLNASRAGRKEGRHHRTTE